MSDTKETNPKDRAATNRLDLSLVPSTAIAYAALALTEGDFKYGGYNWRDSGVKASVYVAALQRHLFKWYNGEDTDSSTGVPHLANAIACLCVLIDSMEHGSLVDDRPPVTDIAYLLGRFEAKVAKLREKFEASASPSRHTELANRREGSGAV